MLPILSVTEARTTPTIIIAAVTSTGLSPEFHFASFKIGRAGSFFLPPLPADLLLLSQSEKSQRSKSRPSPTFGLIRLSCGLIRWFWIFPTVSWSCTISLLSGGSVVVFVNSEKVVAVFNPSRYSRTSLNPVYRCYNKVKYWVRKLNDNVRKMKKRVAREVSSRVVSYKSLDEVCNKWRKWLQYPWTHLHDFWK